MTVITKYKCSKCEDKGYIEYHKLDGMNIYRWQKPLKMACECGQTSKVLLR